MHRRLTFLVGLAAILCCLASASAGDIPPTFVGTFVGDGIELSLEQAGDELKGQLAIRGTSYHVEAGSKRGGVTGSFRRGSDTFAFEARFEGDVLVLTSGGATYRLRRKSPAKKNPLAKGMRNPLASRSEDDAGPLPPLQTTERGDLEVLEEGHVLPNGDMIARLQATFPARSYVVMKALLKEPVRVLRHFRPQRASYEIDRDLSASYDDATRSVVCRLRHRGFARNLGKGDWAVHLGHGLRLTLRRIEILAGRQAATFDIATHKAEGGHAVVAAVRYVLPAGAHKVVWRAEDRLLSYRMPIVEAETAGRLHVELRVRPRLMATVYKSYGLRTSQGAAWIAKAVIRNRGPGFIRDLRVRFRVAGYSEWGLWEKFAELVPTQTAVAVAYPILHQRIARLTSTTPANILAQWSYDDGTGRRIEGDTGGRAVILGIREWAPGDVVAAEKWGTWHERYNNASYLAAWATRNDGVVKQFGAMASEVVAEAGVRKAEGAAIGSGASDDNALLQLRGIYELMLRNEFTYHHPPGMTDSTVSFNPRFVQNVKFPRDVIRDKAGTCIDLAILYATAAHVVGVEAHLFLCPGHCFPVFRLPKSGKLIGVEATGIRGGVRYGEIPFSKAMQYGLFQMAKYQKESTFVLVNLEAMWGRGISPPELPQLPADVLTRWGISAADKRSVSKPEPPASSSAARPNSLVGLWVGLVDAPKNIGGIGKWTVAMRIDAPVDGRHPVVVVHGGKAVAKDVELNVSFMHKMSGSIDGRTMRLRGSSKEIAIGDNKKALSPDTGSLAIRDGRLVGRLGSDDAGWIEFALEGKRRKSRDGVRPAKTIDTRLLLGTWFGNGKHLLLRRDGTELSYEVRPVLGRSLDAGMWIPRESGFYLVSGGKGGGCMWRPVVEVSASRLVVRRNRGTDTYTRIDADDILPDEWNREAAASAREGYKVASGRAEISRALFGRWKESGEANVLRLYEKGGEPSYVWVRGSVTLQGRFMARGDMIYLDLKGNDAYRNDPKLNVDMGRLHISARTASSLSLQFVAESGVPGPSYQLDKVP